MQGSAVAHPNVALIKYWGKREAPGNLPAAGSLSLTLAHLSTRTTVRFDEHLEQDYLRLNGSPSAHDLPRLRDCLAPLRERAGINSPAGAESANDFPTGAGLASSASGMAALALAAASALGVAEDMGLVRRAAMAGSGSAPRSLFGGIVMLSIDETGEWRCRSLLEPHEWPLRVVVAVTETAAKGVSSRSAMELTRRTSPFYRSWIRGQNADLEAARNAVQQRDFERLAELAEHNCLKMHATMLAARPPALYFNSATLECLHRVKALARAGIPVFFTVDAGPQVKAVCLPEARGEVADALRQTPGVKQVLVGGLGPGAQVV
ncbi:diphosphomevalonate decarboxylase [Candidatus Foliamicus sp.]